MDSLRVRCFFRGLPALLTGLCLVVTPSQAQDQLSPIAQATYSPTAIQWQPHVAYERMTLKVGFPTGKVMQQEFAQGQVMALDMVDAQGKPLPDGHYTYELVVTPLLAPGVKEALAQERDEEQRRALIEQLQEQGVLPRRPLIQGGYFTIANGAIVPPAAERRFPH